MSQTPDRGGARIAQLLDRFMETRDCTCNEWEWAGTCWYRLTPGEQQGEFIEFVNRNLELDDLSIREDGGT